MSLIPLVPRVPLVLLVPLVPLVSLVSLVPLVPLYMLTPDALLPGRSQTLHAELAPDGLLEALDGLDVCLNR